MRRPLALALVTAGLAAGCVTDEAAKGDFYRVGFTDGCRSAEAQRTSFSTEVHQNSALFKTEASYRSGWRSGFVQCRETSTMDARPGDLGERDPF